MKILLRISKSNKRMWEETLSKLYNKDEEGWHLTSLLHLHMRKLIKEINNKNKKQ